MHLLLLKLCFALVVPVVPLSDAGQPDLLARYSNITEAWGVYAASGRAGVNLLKVRNTNSGTLTVLASGSTGYLDDAAATSAQGSYSLAVTEVYGQVSGSVVAEQTTSANQPLLVKNPATGIWEIQYGDVNGSWNRYLNLKNVSLSKQNAFVLTVGRAWQNYTGDAHTLNWPSFNFNNSPTSTYQHGVVGRGPFKTLNWYYVNDHSNQSVAAALPWDCRPGVVTLTRTGGVIKVKRYPDAEYSADFSPFGENNSQTYTIGKDGFAGGDSSIGGSHYTELFAIGTYVGDSSRDTISLDFYKTLNGATAWPTKAVWFFGDSQTDGYQVSDPGHRNGDLGIPIMTQQTLGMGSTYLCRCNAKAGWTITQIASERASYFDGSAKDSGLTHYIVFEGGYNDVFAGASAATAYSRAKTFYTDAKTGGATKVMVVTLPLGPGITGTSLTNLQALNASYANAVADGAADVVVDLATVIGTGSGAYQSDGVHLTQTSRNTCAATIATAILANF